MESQFDVSDLAQQWFLSRYWWSIGVGGGKIGERD